MRRFMEFIFIIGIILGLVIFFFLLGLVVKLLKWIGIIVVKFVVGVLLLVCVNMFGGSFGIYVLINLVIIVISGILGILGIVVLVVIK